MLLTTSNVQVLTTTPQLETSLEAKQQEVEALTATYTTIKDQHTVSENKLNADEELLQTLLTGLSSSKANNTGGGYMGQIADAKGRLAKASAEEEQTNCNLQMQQKELKVLEARWKEVERDAGDGKKKVEAMKGAVEQFRKKLITCGWNAEMEEALETKLNNLRTQVRDLKQVRVLTTPSLINLTSSQRNATQSSEALAASTSTTHHPTPTSIEAKSKAASAPSSLSERRTTTKPPLSRSPPVPASITSSSRTRKSGRISCPRSSAKESI